MNKNKQDWPRALSAAMALGIVFLGCSEQAPAPERVRPVMVVKVVADGGAEAVTYTGDVHARYETALGFRVAGKIVSRNVEVGSQVVKGQLLARLDPTDYQLNIEASRSQLAAARSDLLQAEDDLQRYQELFDKKFISEAEFDRRKTAYEVAKAKLEQARAQLGMTRNQSAYTALVAEQAGVITAINVEVGQVVQAGQPVMRLARLAEKEVVISVPEGRLEELRSAGEVQVTLWAQPEARYEGRIREVSPAADPVTRTYTVKVTMVDPSPAVQLGMTANVLLKSATAPAVIRLPLTALYQKDQKPAVWKVDAKTGQVMLTPVQVARYTEEGVEVAAGLNTGDLVVRAGVHKLHAGQKVRVIEPAKDKSSAS